MNRHTSSSIPNSSENRALDVRVLGCSVILVVATLIIYSNCFQGQFVLDDRGQSILKNRTIQNLSNLGMVLIPPGDATVTSRPLLNLTLAINYHFEKTDSTIGYHAVNVLIHVINGLLLFGLIRQTLLGPRLVEKYGTHATALAFACALLWVAHPLCTSCVTYIVQRAESLMTMFLLGTLYCSYCADRSVAYRNSWSIAAWFVCLLGMASKEVMFVAPFLVPIYDWVFGRDRFKQLWERRAGFYIGLAVTWCMLGWTMNLGTRQSISFNFFGQHPLIDVTSWEYATTQAPIVLHYLRLAIWPHPLVFDYDWSIVQSPSEWVVPAIVLIALGIASVVALYRRMPMGFTASLFFLMLGPSSSFLVIYKEVAAEHRMYLPLAAVIVTLVIGIWTVAQAWLQRINLPRTLVVLLAWTPVMLVACVLGWLTHERNSLFHDRLELWEQTAANAPRGARPHHNAGMLYGIRADQLRSMADKLDRQSKIDEAQALLTTADQYDEKMFEYLNRAIEIKPTYPEAHMNLGRELQQRSQLDQAEKHYRQAIDLFGDRPGRFQVTLKLANLRIYQGQYQDAKQLLQGLIDANSSFRVAWQRLAEMCALAPDEQVRDGDRAAEMAQPLLKQGKTPRDVEIYAAALAAQGSFTEATEVAGKILEYYEQEGHSPRAAIMRKRLAAYKRHRPLYWKTGDAAN